MLLLELANLVVLWRYSKTNKICSRWH